MKQMENTMMTDLMLEKSSILKQARINVEMQIYVLFQEHHVGCVGIKL